MLQITPSTAAARASEIIEPNTMPIASGRNSRSHSGQLEIVDWIARRAA